jgi:hypothetical protein
MTDSGLVQVKSGSMLYSASDSEVYQGAEINLEKHKNVFLTWLLLFE